MATTPITNVSKVTVHTKDYAKARTFWTQTIGLKEMMADPEMQVAAFAIPNSPPLVIHQWTAMCEAEGPWHGRQPGTVSGLVFGTADCFRATEDMKKKGVKITAGPEKMPWGEVIASFADPDGNEFILSQTSGGVGGA